MRVFIAVIVFVLLSGCLKEDVSLLKPPDFILTFSSSIDRPHNFIDLKKKRVVQTTHSNEWHLKFENGPERWAVYLNPFVNVSCHNSGLTDFNSIDSNYIQKPNLKWARDKEVDGLVSPAVDDWGDYSFEQPQSHEYVYLIRIIRLDTVYYKLQILGATNLNYTLRYQRIGSKKVIDHLLDKKEERMHTHFRLADIPEEVLVEPLLQDWHIDFSFGLDSLHKNPSQWLAEEIDGLGLYPRIHVAGSQVEHAMVGSDTAFEAIDYFLAKHLKFRKNTVLKNALFNYDDLNGFAPSNATLVCRIGEQYVKLTLRNIELQNGQLIVGDMIAQTF